MRSHRAKDSPWVEGDGYRKRVIVPPEALGTSVLVQEVSFREGDTMPSHYHRRTTELFIPISEGEIRIDGEDVPLTKGTIIQCEPGDVHGIPKVERDFSILVVKVDAERDDTIWCDE